MIAQSFIADLYGRLKVNVFHQPWTIQILRGIACLAVYFVELGIFWPSHDHCRNTLEPEAAAAPVQILVLADPQIITTKPHPSYIGIWARIFFPLVSLFTDRFLNRAWRALKRPGGGVKAWTATVWLGDLTDTGRNWHIDQHLYELYNRFFRIFPEERTSSWNRTYYIPGNHDIALKQHDGWRDQWEYRALQAREYSRWKFLSLFGTNVWDGGWDATPIYPPDPLSHVVQNESKQHSSYLTKLDHKSRRAFNARVPINVANLDGSTSSKLAEVILLDATDIVALQRMRWDPWKVPNHGRPGQDADWREGASWWFVDSLSKDRNASIPRILFTHIPLYREPRVSRESCVLPAVATFPPGVMPANNPHVTRQSKSSLQTGTDTEGTYENMIGKEWSSFILEKIQPNVIFSGDDHDHCHHLHTPITGVLGGQPWTIPELTVNAMSLTSGIRTPGYARLSIWQEPAAAMSVLNGSGLAVSVAGRGPQTRISYVACALPRQIELWATIYPLLLLLVAICLPLQRFWHVRRGGYYDISRGRTRGVASAGTRESKHWLDEREREGTIWDAEEALPLQLRASGYPPTGSSIEAHDGQNIDEDTDEVGERMRLEDQVHFLRGNGNSGGGSSGSGRANDRRTSSRRRSSSSYSFSLGHPLTSTSTAISYHGLGGRPKTSRTRRELGLWVRELRDVTWLPALFWSLLWLLGF